MYSFQSFRICQNIVEINVRIKFIFFSEGIDKMYSVSFMWLPMIGVLSTVSVGLVTSWIAGNYTHVIKFCSVKWSAT